MSIFGNLLGRKGQTSDDAAQKQQFDEEWVEAVKRFGIVTGLGTINLELKHPKTSKVMTPHEGLGQTFDQWKPIQAPYDRRALIFDAIYGMVGRSMNRWQTASYLSAVRSPQRAIALLEKAESAEAKSPKHQAAAARALLNLGRPAEAVVYARQAAEALPEDARLQILYADALHLNGQCEEAHTIYSGLMASAEPIADAAAPISLLFASLFSQETGSVSSPVLAVDIAGQMGDPVQSEEFWKLGENEFYDSAYFRMHHAYHLADKGAMDRGFAKLLALVKEMPWLREPSLNLIQFFDKLDPTGRDIMPEFQARLRQTIAENGWTFEGMNKMTLGQNN